MKIARFKTEDKRSYYGTINGDEIKVINGLNNLKTTGETYQLKEVKLLAPTNPSKIICIGLNYIDHARELKLSLPEEPLIFLKAPTAVIGPNDNIKYPKMSNQVDHEAELAVVISKKCRDVKAEEAYGFIAGYTAFNDVTARDLQRKDGQWTRAKSFDTFAPIGPWITTKDEIPDPHSLDIELRLNGEIRQNSNTKNMIFKIPKLIEFISEIMTLNKGDVISTGTPPGVGQVKPGDSLEVKIEKIGTLKNQIIPG
ncbi:MAG: fumarylacetoacetate hydrolase family protein [Candidatus Hydrothermarchaeales archaeon]